MPFVNFDKFRIFYCIAQCSGLVCLRISAMLPGTFGIMAGTRHFSPQQMGVTAVFYQFYSFNCQCTRLFHCFSVDRHRETPMQRAEARSREVAFQNSQGDRFGKVSDVDRTLEIGKSVIIPAAEQAVEGMNTTGRIERY